MRRGVGGLDSFSKAASTIFRPTPRLRASGAKTIERRRASPR